MILLLSITNVPHVYSLSPSPGQIVQSIVFHVWPTAFKILFLSNPMKTCYKASKILSSQPCQQLISFLPQSHIGPGSNQWEPGSSQWEPGFNQWEPGSNLWEPGSNQWEHIFSERDKGGGGRLNNLEHDFVVSSEVGSVGKIFFLTFTCFFAFLEVHI